MQTKFDHIKDTEIQDSLCEILSIKKVPIQYAICGESDTERIASLAADMNYWKAWVGPPVTFFDESGLNYDGHRRVRACKYIARMNGFQIQIPVRYDTIMSESCNEKSNEKIDDNPLLRYCCGDFVRESIGSTLCR